MENKAFTTPKLYDQLSLRMIPYNEVAALVKKKLDQYAPGSRNLLDLACGTGNLTLELARLGYRVNGLDSSQEMLTEAIQKTATANLDINYFHQDMTEPYPLASLDAITCF